jgi:hypothetical protein
MTCTQKNCPFHVFLVSSLLCRFAFELFDFGKVKIEKCFSKAELRQIWGKNWMHWGKNWMHWGIFEG